MLDGVLFYFIFLEQKENETTEHAKGAIKALQDLYDVIRLDVLNFNMRYITSCVLCKKLMNVTFFNNFPKICCCVGVSMKCGTT